MLPKVVCLLFSSFVVININFLPASVGLEDSESCLGSSEATTDNKGTPVVLWHGVLGYCRSTIMLKITKLLKKNLPSAYIKCLKIGNRTLQQVWNSISMDANQQVELACQLISNDPKLRRGYHAVGLSQGGQFLRAVAQTCPQPPMFNLVSLGGQHQGYYGVAKTWYTLPFRIPRMDYPYSLIVKTSIVFKQNWHNPINHEDYVKENDFIADINNERSPPNTEYKRNLLSLKNLVLAKFSRDNMVLPPASSHFGYYKNGQDKEIENLEDSQLYKEDRIGLKTLKESGRLHFIVIKGRHLKITSKVFVNEIITPWLTQQYSEIAKASPEK